MNHRIVSIQHGDYREALEIVASGQKEPYFGMFYSVNTLEKLFDNQPYMVISMDGPAYHERHGQGELVLLPAPKLPKPIPGRVSEYLLSRRILRQIRAFRPTHILIRTGRSGVVNQILRHCKRHNYNTLVVFANFLSSENGRARRVNRMNMTLMNEPFVFRVGNHRWPATESLVESGLNPTKAVAWDTPGLPQARDFPPKDLAPAPFHLLFVGSISVHKGVGDLIDAAAILKSRGLNFRVSIVGSGTDFDALKAKAAPLPAGLVDFKGRLGNDEVFRLMQAASLVIVPSRHSFPEGLPYTITEGLASRTPLIVSDHPVMSRAFKEGEGLRFFKGSDPSSLAEVIETVLKDSAGYRRLSETTVDAQARVECKVSFGDLLEEWKASFSKGQV